MEIINVNLEGKTSSIILSDKQTILKGLDPHLTLIVTDSNCSQLFDQKDFEILVLPPGERHKNFNSIETILAKAVELGLGRNALFVGIGGGVICDMTAFAASIYLRGCRVQLAPTSLLSMVDASVGGKTGIDYCGYKNLVGAFYPAEKVFIVPEFLMSLSNEEYLSGLGEAIKTAYLMEPQLLSILETRSCDILSRDLSLMEEIIIRCIKVKGFFVENDFKEGGIRAHLNLGHTFGHALEAIMNLSQITHGGAVVWGMLKAAQLAKLIYETDHSYLNRLTNLLFLYDYQLNYSIPDIQDFMSALKHDKKKISDELRFILQPIEFKTEIVPIEEDKIIQVLNFQNDY